MQEYKFKIEVDKFKSHQHSNAITSRGRYTTMYKKKANAIYEQDIIDQLKSHNTICNALDCPISLSIDYYVKIPTTINKVHLKAKERRALEFKYANNKPDLNNITKTIEDCIERAGIITDDMNVVEHHERKFYGIVGDKKEYAYITIKKLP